MSTEQDSVRRLAEIRLELSKYGELPSEEVDYLLSLIDSLTAERTRLLSEERNCADDFWRAENDRVVAVLRAEAAEAEVKRLREALEWVREVAAARIGQVAGADGYYAIASHIRAALATPPSEGGQSSG